MKPFWSKSLATVWVSLSVAVVAQAQPLVGGVESIECAVANSSMVVIGTIMEVHAKEESDKKGGVQATMLVEETLKSSHSDRVRVRLRHPAAVLAGWMERSTRLLVVLSDPPAEMDVIDLTDKGLAVMTSDLTLLRKPDDVIRAAKETVRRMPGVTRIETYKLRVPDRATVAGTKWEKIYESGGYIRVAVPIDDRLEKLAHEYLRTKDPELRWEGALLLRYFKSDGNVARAKALLADPSWSCSRSAEDNRGIEVRSYRVREMAYSTLRELGVRVEKPVIEVEVWKPDVVRVVTNADKVRDADLEKLASFKKLESLLLAYSNVTDEQLKEVAKLADLGDLFLGRTGVTDEGLKHLAPLKNLRCLDLGETAVTDEGLKVLAGFASLRKINLEGAKRVTAGGLAALRKLRPDLKVGQFKLDRSPRAEDEVPHSVLKDWYSARVKEPAVVVLTDEAAYAKLFTESFAEFRSPKPVAEKVDFKSKQVVAVCWGAKNSTGYSISVASVTGTPKGMTITVKTTVPKGIADPKVTYPAVVLVIPKTHSVKVVVTGDRTSPGWWGDFSDLKRGLEVDVSPPAAEPKDKKPKTDAERPQGDHEMIQFGTEKREIGKPDQNDFNLYFQKDRVVIQFAGTDPDDKVAMAFTVDGSQTPKEIDFVGVSSTIPTFKKGRKTLGIYKLDGDTLTLCWADEGQKKRPRELHFAVRIFHTEESSSSNCSFRSAEKCRRARDYWGTWL